MYESISAFGANTEGRDSIWCVGGLFKCVGGLFSVFSTTGAGLLRRSLGGGGKDVGGAGNGSASESDGVGVICAGGGGAT